LKPEISEPFLVDAVNDENKKVMLRALHALGNVSSLSDKSLTKLIHIISTELPEDKNEAATRTQKVTRLIQILTVKAPSDCMELIEKTLLDIVSKLSKDQTWFSKIVKSSVSENNVLILTASVKALNKIGSAAAISSLQEFIKSKSPYAKFIKDALESGEKK
jgi:HEAT repeat protein